MSTKLNRVGHVLGCVCWRCQVAYRPRRFAEGGDTDIFEAAAAADAAGVAALKSAGLTLDWERFRRVVGANADQVILKIMRLVSPEGAQSAPEQSAGPLAAFAEKYRRSPAHCTAAQRRKVALLSATPEGRAVLKSVGLGGVAAPPSPLLSDSAYTPLA